MKFCKSQVTKMNSCPQRNNKTSKAARQRNKRCGDSSLRLSSARYWKFEL